MKLSMNRQRPSLGFTLLEAMIAVVIIGILSSIAYPSYIGYVTKAGRSEGMTAILKVANLQEQFYLDNRTYTNDLTKLGLTASPNSTFVTENGHYKISSTGGTQFTITASAEGSQKRRDLTCQTITLSDIGLKGPQPECWK
ncbi:type IV pilin protein [Shewanella sp.]|nr:type IV pilin protein [Shewanella sp.]